MMACQSRKRHEAKQPELRLQLTQARLLGWQITVANDAEEVADDLEKLRDIGL